MASSFAYRPSIDGLRAIAILAVFIFHLHPAWLPGGFVGVDVFFVLSGYLISSVIAAEQEQGSFNLGKFYQRRIARLLPAFLTMATVTMAAAFFIYPAQDLASTGESLAAAVASVINLKLMLRGTYFELSLDTEPLLHCWSLSVEEQFYLFYPLLLIFLHRRSRRMLILALAGLMIASLVLCLVFTQLRASWAFYLLPTRAWELLAGGLLALRNPAQKAGTTPGASRWAPLIGIALLAASFIWVQEARGFPGYQALLPVIGTLCVIAGSGSGHDSRLQRLLTSPLLVTLGKLSYSLYLWHWPVFSLVDYKLLLLDEWSRILIKIAITVPAAVASYRLIECPARAALNRPAARVPAFAALVASLAICIPLGITIGKDNYLNAPDGAQGKLVFNSKQKAGSIVLMGDSHGSMYGQVAKQLADEFGYRLTVISASSGDPLPALPVTRESLWTQSLETIKQDPPDVLIFPCLWSGKLDPEGLRLTKALDELRPLARKIILITQPPMLPRAATRIVIRRGARPPFYEEPALQARRSKANAAVLANASGNVSVIDVENLFREPGGAIVLWDAWGHLLYHDLNHLSSHGAQQVKARLTEAITSNSP